MNDSASGKRSAFAIKSCNRGGAAIKPQAGPPNRPASPRVLERDVETHYYAHRLETRTSRLAPCRKWR